MITVPRMRWWYTMQVLQALENDDDALAERLLWRASLQLVGVS